MYFAVIFIAHIVTAVQIASNDSLQNIIEEKERIVERLAQAVNEAYNKRCNLQCDDCTFSACGSILNLPHKETINCTRNFGIDQFNNGICSFKCPVQYIQSASSILTSHPYENKDTEIEKCWTTELESTFKKIYQEDKNNKNNLRWQYIGTKSGLVRIFPYYTQPICNSLDPRVRPWYVSATSGPKTIIITLDVSASMMNYGRLQLALAAANTVVGTLTNADYVSIVLFGDKATQLLIQHQKPGELILATYQNKVELQTLIRNITVDPTQSTNFEDAFEKAFDILDQANSTLECNSAILFLTDGHPNKGSTSEYKLTSLVENRNKYGSVIFTYSLGSDSARRLLRGIACASQGVYTHIADGEDLLQQLSQYYEYFALLRELGNESVSWVEPYEDAAGAGLIVTVSKAVYHHDNNFAIPTLIGVVGADILVTDLENAGKESGLDHEMVIQRLASNNKCPTIKKASPCLLKIIRSKGGATQCEDKDLQTKCNTQRVPNCTKQSVDYCNFKKNRFVYDVDLYFHQSCCQINHTITCTNKAINCNFSVVIIPIVIALTAIFKTCY